LVQLIADQLRGKWLKRASFMDETEHGMLANMIFHTPHHVNLHAPITWKGRIKR